MSSITICTLLLLISVVAFCIIKMIGKKDKTRLKADWIIQRTLFFDYMDWLQMEYDLALEAYNAIKSYKKLLEINKLLEKQIKQRQKTKA
jgi:hypothetical protein